MRSDNPEFGRIRSGRLPERTEMEMLRGRQRVFEQMMLDNPNQSREEIQFKLWMTPKLMTLEWQAQQFAAALRREFDTEVEVVPSADGMLDTWVPGENGIPIKFNAEHVDVFPSQTLLTQLTLLFK